jgi:hypothetical protein
LFGAVVCIVGCSSGGFQPLNRAALRATTPRTVVLAVAPSPKFDVKGGAALNAWGVAGALVLPRVDNVKARQAGRAGVQDPAQAIGPEILNMLVSRFSLEVLPTYGGVAVTRDGRGPDLLLQVGTSEWGLEGSEQAGYTVRYEGTLTLIDKRSGQNVAEGICSFHVLKSGDAPTLGELIASDRKLLRAGLESAGGFCVDDYRRRILNI